MRKQVLTSLAIATAAFSLACGASAQVTGDVYSGWIDNGNSLTFTGFIDSFNAPNMLFGGPFFYPPGAPLFGDFALNATGNISVPADGTYTFGEDSDDGSYVFIDNTLEFSNGGPHGDAGGTFDVFLTAGTHSVDLQYFECCGPPATLNLSLPDGVSYTTPDSSEFVFLTPLALCAFHAIRRKIKAA